MEGSLVGDVLGLRATATSLARAQVTPDRQWLFLRRPHPAFVAAVDRLLAAAGHQQRPDRCRFG